MFTGLVEEKGTLRSVARRGDTALLRIAASFASDLSRGDSVAVDGVCLTVASAGADWFEADAVQTTLARTTLGTLRPGSEVNLERAARVGDRLGGHIVSGHVDGVAEVTAYDAGARGGELVIELPGGLERHVVDRGSIALDGVSLTVARVDGRKVAIALIPETVAVTKASGYARGARVNVETDILAKYVEKLTGRPGADGSSEPQGEGITEERLRELGFMGK